MATREYLLRDQAERLLAELGVADPSDARLRDNESSGLASIESRRRAYDRVRDLLVRSLAEEAA